MHWSQQRADQSGRDDQWAANHDLYVTFHDKTEVQYSGLIQLTLSVYHLLWYIWGDALVLHHIITIKSEVSTFLIVVIFFFVVVGLTWLYCHNLSFALYRSRENIEWYMYSSGELFMRSREGYFGVYFPSCEATRETNTKMTLEWAHEQFVTRVHTLFYFLHDITNP